MKKIVLLFFLISSINVFADNNVQWDGVDHRPSTTVPGKTETYRYFDYANNKVIFYLQVYPLDITSANVVWRNGFGGSDNYVSMTYSHDNGGYAYWKAELTKQNSSTLYYVFQINDGSDTDWGGPGGGGANGVVHDNQPTNSVNWWSYDDTGLPVELSLFSAKLVNGIPTLSWQTATEVNNYGFEIERSTDKDAWNKIGFVQGAGNSNSPKNYSYTDNTAVSGKYFYRLKQLDTDGTFDYSPVVEVDMGILPGGYRLEQNYPNPFNPSTSIKFAFSSDTKAAIKVYNALGVEVREIFNGVAEAGRVYDIQFNAAGLSSGVYYYKLITPEKTDVRKMMLTK